MYRFVQAVPTCFRIGDIVEAHFSNVIVPVKRGEKFQMILVLRGLALLDSNFSNVCANLSLSCCSIMLIFWQLAYTKRTSITLPAAKTILSLKRKSYYEPDEEFEIQVTRKGFQQMNIDDMP